MAAAVLPHRYRTGTHVRTYQQLVAAALAATRPAAASTRGARPHSRLQGLRLPAASRRLQRRLPGCQLAPHSQLGSREEDVGRPLM